MLPPVWAWSAAPTKVHNLGRIVFITSYTSLDLFTGTSTGLKYTEKNHKTINVGVSAVLGIFRTTSSQLDIFWLHLEINSCQDKYINNILWPYSTINTRQWVSKGKVRVIAHSTTAAPALLQTHWATWCCTLAWDTLAQVHVLHLSRLHSWSICHTDCETVFVFQFGGIWTMSAIFLMNVKKRTKIA